MYFSHYLFGCIFHTHSCCGQLSMAEQNSTVYSTDLTAIEPIKNMSLVPEQQRSSKSFLGGAVSLPTEAAELDCLHLFDKGDLPNAFLSEVENDALASSMSHENDRTGSDLFQGEAVNEAVTCATMSLNAHVNVKNYSEGETEKSSNLDSTGSVGPQDFTLLRVVGQGAFGKVFQVKHNPTNKVYAMKVMRKDKILKKDHSHYVIAERDVLMSVNHPYIVTLRCSFQTPSKLYLVLDFINGGHLFFNLYRQGIFNEEVASLYTAEMVSAISYLHLLGIVHRDLKPENVLLDSEGHIKITDFGLAKEDMNAEDARSNSFIGTMEYMAPEVIQGRGHNRAVDWWSIGILMYEMLVGHPPFQAKSKKHLQEQILTGKMKFPKHLTPEALSLLKSLLVRDPSKRLGAGPRGGLDVKQHAFFRAIDWAKLERRELKSKFRPHVLSNLCVANFDKIWTDQPPIDSPCGSPSTSSCHLFKDFSYISPSILSEMVERNLTLAS